MRRVLVLLIGMMLFTSFVQAKPAELVVDFSYDVEYETGISGFRLYCITVPGSGHMDLMATTSDVSGREWQTPVLEVPPGKRLAWYIAAVDKDTGQEYPSSNAYMFKLTGQPTIIKIRRK
jgi:hypothetical protein